MNNTLQNWAGVDHLELVDFILRKEKGKGKVRAEGRDRRESIDIIWKGQIKCQKSREMPKMNLPNLQVHLGMEPCSLSQMEALDRSLGSAVNSVLADDTLTADALPFPRY